jgi:HlyD family secretion protein
VRIRIDNRDGRLRPGMNADIEIHVGERHNVLAVPNAALRTQRDAGSAAAVLGLNPADVQRTLAAGPGGNGRELAGTGRNGDTAVVTTQEVRTERMPARTGTSSPAPAPTRRPPAAVARYIVFVKRAAAIEPRWIRTGLTDLDYSEVLDGLHRGDSVLVLPSASLIESQQEMRERINRVTGGGGLPGMRQQTPAGQGAGAAPRP